MTWFFGRWLLGKSGGLGHFILDLKGKQIQLNSFSDPNFDYSYEKGFIVFKKARIVQLLKVYRNRKLKQVACF